MTKPEPRDFPTIATIGHSIHPIETFAALLRTYGITQIADVRLIPRSRRHPQFSIDRFPELLSSYGVSYKHFSDLGGRRRPRPDSPNTAWQVPAFRGYADYMQTARFHTAVEALLGFAQNGPTAVMCAEAVWWQCHRRLLSDFLDLRGVPVKHILPNGPPKPHQLSEFARPDADGVTYPGLL